MKVFHALLILLFFAPAIWIRTQQWTPVTATVDSTRIERTRPGTPAWSLWVDFRYEADGRDYLKRNVDVFHDQDRRATEEEQEDWPIGREQILYRSKRNPECLSLEADGKFEVALVVAVLLSFATSLVFLPFYVARRRKTRMLNEC